VPDNGQSFTLPTFDDLFSSQESRAEKSSGQVVNLPLSEISDFPDHPFQVNVNAELLGMAESIRQYGVLTPAIVRPRADGGYEMIAGHRRMKASELAEQAQIPCIVRELSDDESTILMVDSNLQREKILPSEKAFAYKMKLEAMKRQAGRPSKNNSAPLGQNFDGKTSREVLADKKEAGKALIEACKAMTSPDPVSLGEYRGFKMERSFDSFSKEYRVTLKNALSHTVSLGSDIHGNITRMDNVLESMAAKQAVCEEQLAAVQTQMEKAKEETQTPFPREQELQEKTERMAEITVALKLDEKDREILDGKPDAEDERPVKKRDRGGR